VEQELATGLGEGQIAEFVEEDEVHPGQMIGEPTLSCVAGLGLDPVDEIDHVVEPAAGAGADAASGDGNGQMGLAGAGPTDQHRVAMVGDESKVALYKRARNDVAASLRAAQRRKAEDAVADAEKAIVDARSAVD
jgi:hypothetical protein